MYYAHIDECIAYQRKGTNMHLHVCSKSLLLVLNCVTYSLSTRVNSFFSPDMIHNFIT